MSKWEKVCFLILCLVLFAIPIEHKYDKLFRFFSKTLIPEGLVLPKSFDKKLYFYLSDIILFTLFFTAFFKKKRVSWKRLGQNPDILYLSAFFFLSILSIAFSPLSLYPVAYSRLVQLCTPLLLYFLLSRGFRHIDRTFFLKTVFYALVISSGLQALFGIFQYFHQAPLGLRILGESANALSFFHLESSRLWIFDIFLERQAPSQAILRAYGTLPHANILGGFLMFSLLLSYSLMLLEKKRVQQTVVAMLFFIQYFALMLSFSRSALFALWIGTALFFFIQGKKWGWKGLFLAKQFRLPLFLTLFCPLFFTALLHEQLLARGGLINANELVKKSDQLRVNLQNFSLSVIQKKPLFGVGFQQYSLATDNIAPHNIYLLIASEMGLLAASAFVLLLGYLLYKSLFLTYDFFTSSLLAALVGFLFISFCDFYLLLHQPGRLLFFVCLGLLSYHIQSLKPSSKIVSVS